MILLRKLLSYFSLKWGILLIAVIDIVICVVGLYDTEKLDNEAWYYCMLSAYSSHITGCSLLIIAVFLNKRILVLLYLVTIIIRLIYTSAIFIWMNVTHSYRPTLCILEYLILISLYFWFCAYSWYKALGIESSLEAESASSSQKGNNTQAT
ncbi:uncharacterized protein LOC117567756 isoform X2 [Drosophila albomicans]|uniref:Uncharacterized protein LOC117567756 isoform X2 n=1 Tax=Drosophila albomicans TaxID=7291 RepID=A0A9C6SVL4_DROAB|nr:uncharacterized protein LOC117567756 isoform X2 [Drosophila albomicans]